MLDQAKRVSLLTLIASIAASAPTLAADAPKSSACTQPAMIVFDGSGSMAAKAKDLTRLQSAQLALTRIVPTVSNLRPLGLVIYSGTVTRCNDVRLAVEPALGNGNAILNAADQVLPGGATPLGAAVTVAANYFRDRKEPATLVVVTDGEENCGANICALADELAGASPRIQVHVIGYDLSGIPILRCLADRTDGRYTDVSTADQLTTALDEALSCLTLM
jgi:Ca-activated chloride channel homolog